MVLTYEELGAPSSESKFFSASESDSSSPSNSKVGFPGAASTETGITRLSLEADCPLVETAGGFSSSAALLLVLGLEFSALKLFLAAKALNSGVS